MKATDIPIWLWFVLVIMLLTQASWIFYDASKRGENKWLWGLFGLMSVPGSLIIYLIVTRIMLKMQICHACGRRIRKNSNYCAFCGEKVIKND